MMVKPKLFIEKVFQLTLVLSAETLYIIWCRALYPLAGASAFASSQLVPALAGWLLGVKGGVVFALVTAAINIWLGQTLNVGPTQSDEVALPGFVIMMILGVGLGRLRDAWDKIQREMLIRQQAEAALQESEQKLRCTFEQATDGIVLIDENAVIIEWNAAMETMTGQMRSAVLGQPLWDVLRQINPQGWRHDEMKPAILDMITSGQTENKNSRSTADFLHTDGQVRSVQLAYFPVRTSRRTIAGAIVRDVTKLKRAQQALVRERDTAQKYLDIAQVVLLVLDKEANVTLINQAGARLLGYPTVEIIGKNWIDNFIPPAMRDDVRSVFERILAGNLEPVEYHENPVVTCSGEERIVAWHNAILTDEEGALIGILASGEDITERKRVEEKLADERNMLRILIDSLPVGMYVKDTRSRFLIANVGTASIMGAGEPANLIGKTDWDFYPYELASRYAADEREVMRSGRPLIGREEPCRIDSGETKWLLTTKVPLRNASGQITGIMGIGQDITERKQAEERIARHFRRMNALHTIDAAISGSLDLNLSLGIIVEQALRELAVDAADILLMQSAGQVLEYFAGRGFRTDALQHTRLRVGDGYAGTAAMQRQVVHVPDLRQAPDGLARSPSLAEEGFISYYAVPLIAKGQVKGVLELFHRASLSPDDEWSAFLQALAQQAAIAIDNASLFNDLQRANLDLILAYDTTLEGWSRALDLRDKETEGHSQRVARITERLAHALSMSEGDIAQARRGALLHDIGKLGTPDSILYKQGRLSEQEEELMRQHPVLAYQLLAPITFLRPALDIPYCHHEKYDGTGYPRGLKGEEIPLAARIFAVVDVWDALVSPRPYRQALSYDQAVAYVREQAGEHFDPLVAQKFLDLLPIIMQSEYRPGDVKGG